MSTATIFSGVIMCVLIGVFIVLIAELFAIKIMFKIFLPDTIVNEEKHDKEMMNIMRQEMENEENDYRECGFITSWKRGEEE